MFSLFQSSGVSRDHCACLSKIIEWPCNYIKQLPQFHGLLCAQFVWTWSLSLLWTFPLLSGVWDFLRPVWQVKIECSILAFSMSFVTNSTFILSLGLFCCWCACRSPPYCCPSCTFQDSTSGGFVFPKSILHDPCTLGDTTVLGHQILLLPLVWFLLMPEFCQEQLVHPCRFPDAFVLLPA